MLGLSGLGQTALGALPKEGALPPSSLRAGTSFMGRQEQPDHPRPRFFAGIQGPNVAAQPQVKSFSITVQEPPWHPPSFFVAGIQGPNVRPPTTDFAINRQEQPWHPPSLFWAGRQQAGNVGLTPQIVPKVMIVQERPWHPPSLMFSAPPPTPKSAAKFQFFNTQQQPWHPSSLFFAGHFPVDYEDVQVLIIF